MAEQFDPYHAWLGIPKWDQPANAYRLLGVEVFEKHRNVIEAAANRQMAYLQELSTGDDVELAQKLLGEVSRARVVLLNPEKKKAYDKKLTAQLESLPEAKDGTRPPSVSLSHRSSALPIPKKEKSLNRLTVLRTSLLAVVGLLAIMIALLFREKPLEVQVYEDKNKNGQFDPGEHVPKAFITKYDIKTEIPGDLGYTTDDSGIAIYPNLVSGHHFFTLLPTYEIIEKGKEPRPYVEAEVTGSRFFAQQIQIAVREIPKQAPETISQENKPRETIDNRSEKTEYTIKGQIFRQDASGEKEGLNDLVLFLDTDGDGIFFNGKERWSESAKDGNFILRSSFAEDDEAAVVFRQLPFWYRDPGTIPVPLADAKEGTIDVPIKLEPKELTISGNVKVQPEGESSEGLTVYFDRNGNKIPDEGEPQAQTDSDGEYTLKFPLEPRENIRILPTRIRLQPPEGDYLSPKKADDFFKGRIDEKAAEPSFAGANFVITKNTPDKPPEGDPETNGEEENQKEEPPIVIAGPETDPEGYLRQLGFEPTASGAVDKDNKPIWHFKVDADLPKSFDTARSQYTKAQKKEKWDETLSRLNVEIATQTAYAKNLHSEAKNARSKTDRENAAESARHADERLGKLEAQRADLQEAKTILFEPYKTAARALADEQQRYEDAKAEADSVKLAADKLGVKIEPVSKKDQKPWKEAALFNAEITLKTLGLIKPKRGGWQPSGLPEFRNTTQKLQGYQRAFALYLQQKKQLLTMKEQGNPALQSDITKLQRQIDQTARQPQFKKARKQLTPIAEGLIKTIDRLQGQRTQLEEKKAEIEAALKITGGNYKKLMKQYPSSEDLQAFSIEASDLLQQVQN